MLTLDDIRCEFARFLSAEPSARFRMDAALAHVIQLSYNLGITDGNNQAITESINEALRLSGDIELHAKLARWAERRMK